MYWESTLNTKFVQKFEVGFFKGGHKLNSDAYKTACIAGNADMHWREKTHFCILGIQCYYLAQLLIFTAHSLV